MADFTLDTSGTVHFSTAYAKAHGLMTFYRWSDLSPFEQGYVERLFESLRERWLTIASERQQSAWNLHHPGFFDLNPETLAAIRKDCAARIACYGPGGAAHRNDRGLGEAFWTNRQQGCHAAWPPRTPFLDDEGKVRLRTA